MPNCRLILIIVCLLLPVLLPAAEVSPQRLALLRGAIALAEGDGDALADLQQAAQMSSEDWCSQMLYGEALAQDGQAILAKGQLRRAALLAPWRPEPWQAIARTGRACGDIYLEFAGLAGLMRVFPHDPGTAYRMAFLYRMIGEPVNAEKILDEWKASLPPLQLTGVYPDRRNPATLPELRRLLQDKPRDPAMLAALAAAEWQAGNGEAACTALQTLYALQPADRVTQRNLAHILLALGRTDDALHQLQTVPPGDDALEKACALWSISTRQYAEALPPLTQLVQRHPNDIDYSLDLGIASYLAGDQTTALATAQSAWAKSPDYLNAPLYAVMLVAGGRAAEAEPVITQAVAKYPRETLLRLVQAKVCLETNRRQKAAEITADVAPQRPETMELTILAGERFLAAGDSQQARAIARRLRDLYPSDLLALHGAVELFRQLFLPGDAMLTLTRYLGPNIASPISRPAILCEVARYSIEDHHLAAAVAAMEELLRVNPEYRPAYGILGKVHQQLGDWVAAVECYKEAHTRWPHDAALTLSLARAARETGDLNLAIDSYRAVTTLTRSAQVWLELGEVYHILKDDDHARECWQTAATRPLGALRAQLNLLELPDSSLTPAARTAILTRLLDTLNDERERHGKFWRGELAFRGITATDAEIAELLRLAEDLIDPALLQERIKAAGAEQDRGQG